MRGMAVDIRGITPACAGKRVLPAASALCFRDHPRVCGEKKLANFDEDNGKGSPPRMRGKVAVDVEDNKFMGITPAYAGKSLCW